MKGPSSRQLDVLRYVAKYSTEHGYPPTMREIAEHLGTVRWLYCIAEHLQRLEQKGLITRKLRVARSAVLTDAGRAELAKTAALDAGAVNDVSRYVSVENAPAGVPPEAA